MAILNRIDNRLRDFDKIEFSWIEPLRINALYMIGDYNQIFQEIESYPFFRVQTEPARLHLRSLVRVDSISAIRKVLNSYLEQGLLNGRGDPVTGVGGSIGQICQSLLIR